MNNYNANVVRLGLMFNCKRSDLPSHLNPRVIVKDTGYVPKLAQKQNRVMYQAQPGLSVGIDLSWLWRDCVQARLFLNRPVPTILRYIERDVYRLDLSFTYFHPEERIASPLEEEQCQALFGRRIVIRKMWDDGDGGYGLMLALDDQFQRPAVFRVEIVNLKPVLVSLAT